MKRDKSKYLTAKPDIDAAIKRHGFESVNWVVNKKREENALKKQLARETNRLNERMKEIRAKLDRVPK